MIDLTLPSGGGSGSGDLLAANNLSDVASVATSRTNLGLTALAVTTPGTGVATALGVALGSAGSVLVTNYAADAGASDTYAATLSPAPSAYVTGAHYRFKANTSNTGAATINFNSLGAISIVKVAGGITTSLADNDIRAGQWVDLVYDGTNMQMQSTLGNAATAAASGYVVKTANYTAVAGDKIAADVTGGAFTITLPATPADADSVEIVPARGTFASNNLTIARNGEDIDGAASNMTLAGTWGALFVYRTGYGWKMFLGGFPQTSGAATIGQMRFDPTYGTVSDGSFTMTSFGSGAVFSTDGAGNAGLGSTSFNSGVLNIVCAAGVTARLTADGPLELLQVASGKTVAANSARIYSKIVGGTAQVETATVVGTVTGDGDARAIVTSAHVTGSPLNVDFAVLNGDTASDVGGKLRTALNGTTAITDIFTVSGAGADAILTMKTTPGNDATLNIATDNLTCTGLTAAPTSANTTAGTDGTAEMFVKDEAGNETQISPHSTSAPAHLIDGAFDEIGYTANYYTGIVSYTNKQRLVNRAAKAQYHETFDEHNARLNLTGDRALVQLDWATVQAAQVAARDAERTAWLERKTAWEADPNHAGQPFTEPEPALLVAKPVPAWLTTQLAERAAFFAERDAALARKVWTSFRFLKRFTSDEHKAIKTKGKTDDIVADFELLATAAQEILSDDPKTIAGMNYLVSVGVLTEQRKNEILSGA